MNRETMSEITTMSKLNQCCLSKIKNVAMKKFAPTQLVLTVNKKDLNNNTSCTGLCNKEVLTIPVDIPKAPVIAPAFHKDDLKLILENQAYINNSLNIPVYTNILPAIVPNPVSLYGQQIYPMPGSVIQPVLTPIVPQLPIHQNVSNIPDLTNDYVPEQQVLDAKDIYNAETFMQEKLYEELDQIYVGNQMNCVTKDGFGDPLEVYLSLPKAIFPSANMLALDPNPIIDEFCKMPNMQRHAPWLLDLEFGIPKTVVTRPLPVYNVKLNSINCKNTPDAIHPGFESCNPDFKRVMLFYYDCVVSAWYRGYMTITLDRSVENFQSWLLLPMQVLGMCWS
ncbi:uncharacterized protein LOC111357609 [Spodoptera litura]|uniref:Uncharacterized protein LOC111357609 n=1 Tax=Spodoptera litura TaxID=69820 RepID=A0A9J7EGB8_SPOLT|nr:uncharacterized protein LOC111357609 [Spodoptera litura]